MDHDHVADLRARLGALEGRAASDDGFITATATDHELRSLRLEPKAMRMASEDLAEEIVSVVARAREDFDRARTALLAELGVAQGEVDLAHAARDLRDLDAAFRRGSEEVQAVVEQHLRRHGLR